MNNTHFRVVKQNKICPVVQENLAEAILGFDLAVSTAAALSEGLNQNEKLIVKVDWIAEKRWNQLRGVR